MGTIIVIIALCAFVMIIKSLSKDETKQTENNSQNTKLTYELIIEDEDDGYRTRHHWNGIEPYAWFITTVAGVNYHLSAEDANNKYCGITAAEKDNKFDPNAIKLVTNEGKMLGYVPAKDLKEFRDIFEKEEVGFIAYIGWFRNDEDEKIMYGKVMFFDLDENDEESFKKVKRNLDLMVKRFTTE